LKLWKDAQASYMPILKKIKREMVEGKTLLGFGALRSIGQGLAMLEPLIVAKIFAPELFASYILAKMIVYFFLTLTIVSSTSPFIVFASQERVETGKINRTFSVQLTFLTAGILVFVAIILPFQNYFAAFAGISSGDLAFVLLACVGLALKTFVCNLLMAINARVRCAAAELTFGILILSLLLYLCFIGKVNIKSVFLIQFIASLLAAGIFARSIDFRMMSPFHLDGSHLRQMFAFTKWVFVGAMAIFLVDWGDNLVMRYFVPMGQIGIYNFAYQIFKGIIILITIVDSYFTPFVSMNIGNKEVIRTYMYSKRPKVVMFGLAVICILFLAIPPAAGLVYKNVYRGSNGVLMVLLISAVLALYSAFFIPLWDSLKRYRFAQVVNISQGAAKIILGLILVPLIGIYGAAIATVSVYLLRAVSYEIYFRKYIKGLLRE
jgi:O-antigen/teichoic acid export membrane protein